MSNLSSVVIVGRTNVGKSTLFNALSQKIKSITLDYVGVTRDFIKDIIQWKDASFELVDTGGISLRKTDDPILEKVRTIALARVDEADLILFVVDPLVGILPEDREIATVLHKLGKKTILIINKIDNMRAQEHIHEFERLGFEKSLEVSAEHAKGINDILDEILEQLPKKPLQKQEEKPDMKVVFLGKPNVGKSSLMNALLHEERAIVSDIPGTTREAISERVSFYQQTIELTDTPGIRRQRSVSGSLEPLMVKSSFHALKHADVIVLVIDVTQAQLVDQELKLAYYAFTEQYKALIILFNKIDLKTEHMGEELDRNLSFYEHLIKKVPTFSVSCKSGKNLGKLLPLIHELWQKYRIIIPDEEINRLLISSLAKKPLYHNQELLRVYSVRQVASAPLTIVLYVNEPKWFEEAQLGFFENVLRNQYDLVGTPVKFILKKKS